MDSLLGFYLLILAALVLGAACAGVYLRLLKRRDLPRSEPGDPVGYRERACRYCANFDLEEGQAMIQAHTAFREVAQHLRPAEHVRSEERELDDPLRVPLRATWADFGLCSHRKEGVWGDWTKEKRSLTVLRDEDGQARDCWRPR